MKIEIKVKFSATVPHTAAARPTSASTHLFCRDGAPPQPSPPLHLRSTHCMFTSWQSAARLGEGFPYMHVYILIPQFVLSQQGAAG